MTPQALKVRDYIEVHGTITPLHAWRVLGVYRLSARILELRRSGINVKTTLIKVRTTGARVASYSLEGTQ